MPGVPFWLRRVAAVCLFVIPASIVLAGSATHDARVLWVNATQSVFKVSPVDGAPELELAGMPQVQALAVDQTNDDVWVYSHWHLWAFDSQGKQLVNEWLLREIRGGQPVGMVVDGQAGNLWIGTQTRLYRLDLTGRVQSTIDLDRPIEGLTLDPTRSHLWVAERDQLAVLDKTGTTLFTVPTDRPPQTLAYDANLDQVWVVSGRTVSRYDASGNQVFTMRESGDINDHIAPDGQGGLWAAGDTTLSYVDNSGNIAFTLTPFTSDPDHDGDMDRRGRIVDLVADPLNHTAWVADARYLEQYATDSTLKQTIDIATFTGNNPDCPVKPWLPGQGAGNDTARCRPGRGGWWPFWFGNRGVHHVALYVDTIPPTLSITSPTDGLYTNHPQLPLVLTYSDAGSGVDPTSVKVTNDGVNIPVTCKANTDNSGATCTPSSALPDGKYDLEVTVSDYAGNVSKPASVYFIVDTVPPPLPAGALIGFVSGPGGTVILRGQAGSVASDVASVTITNVHTQQKVTGTVNADGSFSIPIDGTNSDEFFITLTDLAGNVTAPFYMHGGDSAMQLTISSPAAGATITGNVTNVTGTFLGPINTGITVNGEPAILSDGEWIADNVVLTAGVNNLTVVATTSGSLTLTQTVNVTSSASTPLILTATPGASGVAPFTATFQYQFMGATAPQSLKIDYTGSGTYVTVSDPSATLSYTYTSPGIYPVTLILTDSNNAQYQAQILVVVQDADQMDTLFKGIWGDMTTALANGNKAAVMNELDGTAQRNYGTAFDVLMPHMQQIVSTFSPLLRSAILGDIGEYAVVRPNNGQQELFFIYFIKDQNGIWRLDSM